MTLSVPNSRLKTVSSIYLYIHTCIYATDIVFTKKITGSSTITVSMYSKKQTGYVSTSSVSPSMSERLKTIKLHGVQKQLNFTMSERLKAIKLHDL